jgi:hypothetical protein
MKKFIRLFAIASLGASLLSSTVYAAASGSVIPLGATQVNSSSGNVAAAVATATIPAVSGRLNYITGFSATGSGATAGLPVACTITGLLGGTETFITTAAIGVLVGNAPLNVNFPTPIPASAINTAIVVSCPSLGVGNTNSAVNAWGFVE